MTEVKEMFNKYTEGGTHMTVEQLRRFLAEVQGHVGTSMAEAQQIVEQILQRRYHLSKFARRSLTLDDFQHYLFSTDYNSPILNQVRAILVLTAEDCDSYFRFYSWLIFLVKQFQIDYSQDF